MSRPVSKNDHLDAASIGTFRAFNKWTRFLERVDATDHALLDRLAVGDALKVAAKVVGVSYECAQKRIARHAAALKLRSSAELFSLWRTMHSTRPVIQDETPTLLLYAHKVAELMRGHDRHSTATEISRKAVMNRDEPSIKSLIKRGGGGA